MKNNINDVSYDSSLVSNVSRKIIEDIVSGVYAPGARLPSVNQSSRMHGVARDTAEKAYNRLKIQGYIVSVARKGYFVSDGSRTKIKVLLLFNKLSYYKKMIYDALIETLGEKAIISIYIHNYSASRLDEILMKNLGDFNYYVLMPYFTEDSDENAYMGIIRKVPLSQLILLDRKVALLPGHRGVFQNFDSDIYHAFITIEERFDKYNELILIFPERRNHPKEIIKGVSLFAQSMQKKFFISADMDEFKPRKGRVFITLTEADLAQAIRDIQYSKLVLGKEVGIVSFNETIFKELLNITVVTTDFRKMGKSLGKMILLNRYEVIDNPFNVILRNSL